MGSITTQRQFVGIALVVVASATMSRAVELDATKAAAVADPNRPASGARPDHEPHATLLPDDPDAAYELVQAGKISADRVGLSRTQALAIATSRLDKGRASEEEISSFGPYPDALPLYRRARAVFPSSASLLEVWSWAAIRAGATEEAERVLRTRLPLESPTDLNDSSRVSDCERPPRIQSFSPPDPDTNRMLRRMRPWMFRTRFATPDYDSQWLDRERYHTDPFWALVTLLRRSRDHAALDELIVTRYADDPGAQAEIFMRLGDSARAKDLYETILAEAVKGPATRRHADMAARLIGMHIAFDRPRDAVRVYDTLLMPIVQIFPACGADEFVANAHHARVLAKRCGAVVTRLAADGVPRDDRFVTKPCPRGP